MTNNLQHAEFILQNHTEGNLTFTIPGDELLTVTVPPRASKKIDADIEMNEEFSMTLDESPELVLSWEGGSYFKQRSPLDGWSVTPLTKGGYRLSSPTLPPGVSFTLKPTLLTGNPPSIGIMIVGTIDVETPVH